MSKIRLDPAASKMTILGIGDVEILFSYRTPVAAFIPGRGYVRTAHKFSKTTSKHINIWAGRNATEVPQAEIESLVEVQC